MCKGVKEWRTHSEIKTPLRMGPSPPVTWWRHSTSSASISGSNCHRLVKRVICISHPIGEREEKEGQWFLYVSKNSDVGVTFPLFVWHRQLKLLVNNFIPYISQGLVKAKYWLAGSLILVQFLLSAAGRQTGPGQATYHLQITPFEQDREHWR